MELKKYGHKVQYYETDQMGIVHHSNYIRWMEEARVDLLEQIGIGLPEIEAEGIVIPVLNVNCEYRSMAKFSEKVIVDLKVRSYNGIKLIFEYEMKNSLTGETRAVGSSSHCFLSKEGKLLSLKKTHPELHQRFESLSKMEAAGNL